MDEPTSALDPIATNKIEDLMEELKKDYTIVIVTHSMQQASRVVTTPPSFCLVRLWNSIRRAGYSSSHVTSVPRIILQEDLDRRRNL